MNLNRSNLINHFKEIHFHKDDVIFDEETLNIIHTNFNKATATRPYDIVIDKPYGIVALTDNVLNNYSVTTFHYSDFRWYPIQLGAKIMHKANIEEWQDGKGYSCNFSKSPFRYSGDVCGVMRGDYRECFDAIKEKEEQHQLLYRGSVKLPNEENEKFRIQCGVGLETLTIIEKFTKEHHQKLGLYYIY